MSAPVGLQIPLLPITGAFMLPFSAYHCFLSMRVTRIRRRNRKSVETALKATPDSMTEDALVAAHRAHGNFVENVPLALLLAAVAEINGGSKRLLTCMLGGLCIFRILHAEYGMMVTEKRYAGRGRVLGHAGTMTTILALGGYATWLVRGYWGF